MMSPMAKPVDATERAQIVERIKAGDTCGQIAKAFNRSKSTINSVAHHADVGHMFDRSATKRATEDRRADNDALRAQLETDTLIAARRELAKMDQPTFERKAMVVSQGGERGSVVEIVDIDLPEPTFADKRNIAATVQMLATTAGRLSKVDESGQANAKGMLERLVDGLEQVAA